VVFQCVVSADLTEGRRGWHVQVYVGRSNIERVHSRFIKKSQKGNNTRVRKQDIQYFLNGFD